MMVMKISALFLLNALLLVYSPVAFGAADRPALVIVLVVDGSARIPLPPRRHLI